MSNKTYFQIKIDKKLVRTVGRVITALFFIGFIILAAYGVYSIIKATYDSTYQHGFDVGYTNRSDETNSKLNQAEDNCSSITHTREHNYGYGYVTNVDTVFYSDCYINQNYYEKNYVNEHYIRNESTFPNNTIMLGDYYRRWMGVLEFNNE